MIIIVDMVVLVFLKYFKWKSVFQWKEFNLKFEE